MADVGGASLEVGEDRMEIRVLGPLQVRRADGSVVDRKDWRTGKTLDLLRLLALRGGEAVSVGELLEALWPTVDEIKGRASLRTAASQIRRVLQHDCIERRLGGLALRDAWVDAVAFTALAAEARRLLREGRLPQALTVTREAEALYLEEFRAHDNGAEWATRDRERLAGTYRTMVADAADAAVELGWMRDAVDFASRSLAVDPLSERAYRALMQAYAGLGEIEQALREFERCRSTLADELGADPSAQTRALHLQLLSVEPVVQTTPPFVGRDAELQWLRAVIRSALDNREPALVGLTGEPGVGKNRLVEEASRDAGGPLVRVTCAATAGRRVDVLDQVLAGLGIDARDDDRSRQLEDAVTTTEPLVIMVQDVHLADSESVATLASLVPRLKGPAAILLTADAAEGTASRNLRDTLTGLFETGTAQGERIHALELTPLVTEEIEQLAELLLAGPPSRELVTELVSESRGRPGQVAATVRSWSRAGRIASTTSGLALMPPRDESGPDPAMRPLLTRALEQLSAGEQEVLHLAAVLTGAVNASLIAPLIGDDEDAGAPTGADVRRRVQSTLDRLVDLSLLTAEPGGYVFRHPLLRDAVQSWLRSTARRRLHRRVAERAVLPGAERIQHWLAAGEPQLGCAAALDASVVAMAEGRYDDARSHLMQVCSLGDMPEAEPSDRVNLFERLGDACAMLGRRGEARAAFAVAAKVSRAHHLPDLPRVAGKLEAVSAQDWVEESSPATALAPPSSTESLADRLGIDPTAEPDVEVEEMLRAALEDADRRNDPVERVEARLLLSRLVCIPRRQLAQARSWTQQALSITVDPGVRAEALHVANLADVLLGNARSTEQSLDQARELAREAGDERVGRRLDLLRCLVAHDLGRSHFDELWAELSQTPDIDEDGTWSWTAVRILTERGSLGAAREADAAPVPAGATPLTRQLRRLASAVLHEQLGEHDLAITLLQGILETATSDGCLLLLPEAAARLVVLESASDKPAAREHFDLFDWAVGAESGLPREGCWRLLARAAVRCADGQHDRAAAAAANAADVTESRGLLFLAARAHLARAQYLADAGWASESRLASSAAGRCYRSAGADALARRVEAFAPSRARRS